MLLNVKVNFKQECELRLIFKIESKLKIKK